MASSYYGTKNNIKRNPSMQYAIIYANARPYSGYVNWSRVKITHLSSTYVQSICT